MYINCGLAILQSWPPGLSPLLHWSEYVTQHALVGPYNPTRKWHALSIRSVIGRHSMIRTRKPITLYKPVAFSELCHCTCVMGVFCAPGFNGIWFRKISRVFFYVSGSSRGQTKAFHNLPRKIQPPVIETPTAIDRRSGACYHSR